MKIGSIVIHCYDFDRTVAFWQAALHYVPREPAKDGWVVLRDLEDKGPSLSFQGRDKRPCSRSWLHLDLYTADQQAEVERQYEHAARTVLAFATGRRRGTASGHRRRGRG